MNNDDSERSIYVGDEPDVPWLNDAYSRTLTDLGDYFQSARNSYDLRHNIWPGKSPDLRKHGADAFPWPNASDTEVHLISQRLDTYVALFNSALSRSHIRAYPVETGDMGRAKVISSFLRWMVNSYIPDFPRQVERGANYLLERGIMVTYVGWQKEQRSVLQKFSIDQIGMISPDLRNMILDGNRDDELVEQMRGQFQVKDSRLRKMFKQLRAKGEAELPVSVTRKDCPLVQALAPDSDVFFPAYTIDYQKVPYCFRRVLMTAQEIEGKVASDGWDRDWADEVLKTDPSADVSVQPSGSAYRRPVGGSKSDLYEIIYAYQRLIDDTDEVHSEGIYCTVFSPKFFDNTGRNGVQTYAKFELLNGYDDYPFVVTKISEDSKRLYEMATLPEKLRGSQWQVKVERDSRCDRNSLSTCPPMLYPAGGDPPASWGPRDRVPYRRMGEIMFGPAPAFNPGSIEIENTMILEADNICGLNPENPLSAVRQQFLVNKFLCHIRDVLALSYQCYQRFGPEEVFFRVTGNPDPQRFSRGNPDEKFDIIVDFDVLSNDPENLEKQLNQMVSLVQLDKNGRMNMDRLLEAAAAAINPVMADAVMQPAQQASEQLTRQVTDDLSKIFAGIEVPARPNGAQAALQLVQQYLQQPDIFQRYQADKAFKDRIDKYMKQYQFQLQQAQNAQIGRIGTAPAAMGGATMQGVNMGGGGGGISAQAPNGGMMQ